MDEGIVERCEDTGDAEDEFTCTRLLVLDLLRVGVTTFSPSRT